LKVVLVDFIDAKEKTETHSKLKSMKDGHAMSRVDYSDLSSLRGQKFRGFLLHNGEIQLAFAEYEKYVSVKEMQLSLFRLPKAPKK
jgi:hypothetical protein